MHPYTNILRSSLALLLSSAALSADLRVVFDGTVDSTFGTPPPALVEVIPGAKTNMDIVLLEPADKPLPDSWMYTVDYGASSVSVGSSKGYFDPLNFNPGFGIANDATSGVIDALDFGGVLDGDVATISCGLFDPSAAAFTSVNVRDMIGWSTGPFPLTVATISVVDPMSGFYAVVTIDEIRFLDGEATGNTYCEPTVPNSTGALSRLTAEGSTVVAENDLTLVASDLPLDVFGMFLTSREQGLVVGPGGSQGTLCLGGGIGRFNGPGQIKNSGSAGTFELTIDLNQLPTPSGFVAALPGETWNFQAWHRDWAGPVSTSNFTNGLEIQLQ